MRILGEKWAILAIREVAFGVGRFDEIVLNTGAARDVLTTRLRNLEAHGLIVRKPYQQRPVRYEYVLSEAGQQLFGVLHMIRDWGDRYVRDDPENIVRFTHSCGNEYHPDLRCAACGESVTPGSTTLERDLRYSDLAETPEAPAKQPSSPR